MQKIKSHNQRKRRKPKLLGISLIFFLLLWAVIAGAVFSYYYKVPANFWEGIIPLPDGDTVSVTISSGMTALQAARAFEIQGALSSGSPSQLARWLAKFGIDKKIRAGHYSVVPSDPWNLARQLRIIKPALLKLQILPGLDIFALAENLEDQDSKFNMTNFTRALLTDSNYPDEMQELIKSIPDDEYTRLAFLEPETYMLINRTPDEAVQAASTAWWRQRGDLINAKKLTSSQLVDAAIIASMIEREVLHDSECRTVSGVINNRIKSNMALQIDATVVYAWRLAGRKVTRVLNKDLEIDSPYNTYKISGLPPKPICIPGSAAWGAALEPEENNYYYYVARKDGYHYFSKTFNEHRRNIKLARSEK
ncbi:MAG: endolytic transglycosylase MltG [Synergistaceae bacterium]|nr:endolytic transglycosylase MltG [Synergistaceae bacterium]